ncbi:MAG: 16S rRNA (adenine(1518)-N(6)/adenine(1519)-N(6))-dimethyltransferase RsmA [Wolbachia endosymbiont of Tyrophagus putrescentiae]|nr:16S rRNA (adenine(1518)-N(6)/adenine(1519)-N(6))-dimethyltransferase RsmA [Wolbachia endosymbiont of Tyrophagus putrescentiae]
MEHIFSKPKKSLGQNFILSSETVRKIVDLSGDLGNFNVIEIGPGHGALTREILKRNPKCLLAVEKDSNLIKQHSQLLSNRYKIIEADALDIVEEKLVELPVKVIANLPYNISVPLLIKWLNNIKFFTSLTLMFQKEVAERIVAQPNSKNYGYLSIITQLLCDVKVEFHLSPQEFFPKPKVYSSVVTIKPLPTERFLVDRAALAKLAHTVFSQRRKMLRTSLKSVVNNVEIVLKNAQLSGNERPENLTIEQFCLLANSFVSLAL